MLMDLVTLDWSPAMMALFGIERVDARYYSPSTSNFGAVSADVVPELAGVPITGSARGPAVGPVRSGLLRARAS